MKKLILFLCSVILSANTVFAAESCFIAKENSKTLKTEGDCETRYAPESTFKIPLSLIGFDSGILKSESNPSWSLPEGADPYINVCKGDHNPRTWMRDSCLWYKDGNKTDMQHGWFVGYIEKGNRRIVFASHVTDSEKQSTFASFRARNQALIKLWYLISNSRY